MPGKNTSVVLVLVLSLLAVLASPVFSARPLQSTVEEGLSKSALEEFEDNAAIGGRRLLQEDVVDGVSWELFVCVLSKGRSPFCREVVADPEVIIEAMRTIGGRRLPQEDDVELELEEEEAEKIGRKLLQEDDVELELEEEEAEKIGRKLQGSGDLPNVDLEIIKFLQDTVGIGRKLR